MQLERLFAEHVDTCSHRYDVWVLGLVRSAPRDAERGGHLRPNAKDTSPGRSTRGWKTCTLLPRSTPRRSFRRILPLGQFPGTSPLLEDAGNGGYIATPSMPQAGNWRRRCCAPDFLAARSGGVDTGQLSVNLSSSTRPRGTRADRRNSQWSEPWRAARLSVRNRHPRRLFDRRSGQVHLPIAQGAPAGGRFARAHANRPERSD